MLKKIMNTYIVLLGISVSIAIGQGLSPDPILKVINQSGNYFGLSTSAAGDINGDGHKDFVVGGAYANKVVLYYGNAKGPSENNSVTFNGISSGNINLGSAVGYGDFNKDGFSDLVLSDRGYSNGQTNEGVIQIYLGSATGISTTPTMRIESNVAGSYFGMSASGAGDINNDGYDDVVVGAPYFSNGELNEGAVYVYIGSATGLDTTHVMHIESNRANALIATFIRSAGDVDGDGFDDIIFNTAYEGLSSSDTGGAYIYYGSATGIDTTRKALLKSGKARVGFYSVSGAGDVNKDGYADVICGAGDYTYGEGAVFIYHGSAAGISATPAIIIEENISDSRLGSYVGGNVDLNADGYADVIAGASQGHGYTSVYFGGATGITKNHRVMLLGANGERFGYAVAGIGDVNGDKIDDFISTSGYTNLSLGSFQVFAGCKNGMYLVSPTNLSDYIATAPKLIWSKGFVTANYQVQVDTTNLFGAPILNTTLADTSIQMSTIALGKTYFWRIRSLIGDSLPWVMYSFKTGLSKPLMISPATGLVGQPDSMDFNWNSVAGAENYEFQLLNRLSFHGGLFTDTTFHVNSLMRGEQYTWKVRVVNAGHYSDWASGYFTTLPNAPNAPFLASPNNNTINQSQSSTIYWNKQAYVDSFRVQVSIDSNFLNGMIVDNHQIDSAKEVWAQQFNTTYFWRVQAINLADTSAWSQVWRFTTVPNVPDSTSILEPVCGSVNAPTTLTLKWKGLRSADSSRIVVYQNSIQSTPMIDTTKTLDIHGLDTTEWVENLNISGLSNGSKYYFRVLLKNAGGGYNWSSVCSVTTIVSLPQIVTLKSHNMGDTVKVDSVLLKWLKGTPIISSYQIQFSKNIGFDTSITDSSMTDTSWMAKGLVDKTQYYWRVKAKNDAGWGGWSTTGMFVYSKPAPVSLPQKFELRFSSQISGGVLKYALPQSSMVRISLYNLQGAKVYSQNYGLQAAGYYSVSIGQSGLSNGQYLLQFIVDKMEIKKSIVLIK